MTTETPSPFTVVGAAVYDAATDTLEEPNRWEPVRQISHSDRPDNRLPLTGRGHRHYRDTL